MITNQQKRRILAGLIITTISILGSCSKQTSPGTYLKRLDNKQALTAGNIKDIHSQPKEDLINISSVRPVESMAPSTPTNTKEDCLKPVSTKNPSIYWTKSR